MSPRARREVLATAGEDEAGSDPDARLVAPVVGTSVGAVSMPPDTPMAGSDPGAGCGIACGSIKKPDSRSISSSAIAVLKRTFASTTWYLLSGPATGFGPLTYPKYPS